MRKLLLLLAVCISTAFSAFSQCSSGYTTASLNWDALDYIPSGGYSNPEATALSPSQFFTFGKNRLNIRYTNQSPNIITSDGEKATHTGDIGSYGSGDDVQYKGNGTITLFFETEVTNVKFSLYDIDVNQKVQISGVNAANLPQNIQVTLLGSTILSVANNDLLGPTVSASGTAVSQASVNASFNIDIATPVKTITLNISNSGTVNGQEPEDGFYWLSDIQACTAGSFPTDYYKVSQPYTGMPSYVLVAANKGVYMVDPATGKAKFIFSDASTTSDGTVNSLAYDPYKKIIYYTWSLTNNGAANASERTLRKYDLNLKQSTVLLSDARTLGIPTFDQGVESGAAAFYDGAYYIGIEGGAEKVGNSPKTSTYKESIVWRIDIDNSGVPTRASQVFGTSGDTHDWGDFAIANGILYDFNGEDGGAHYFHYNLQTGNLDKIIFNTYEPRQAAVGWDNRIYWVGNQIAQYNLNGSVGTRYNITSNPVIPNYKTSGSPSFGDAAEAFRPAVDFGDAPITFDPDPLAPALHETISTLRLGATTDVEWDKPVPGTDATVDGSDEDGLAFVRIFVSGVSYQTDLRVFNNTGANATVCAWLDFNNDGQFQAEEGISQTVGTSTTTQNVNLYWPTPVSSLPNNSYSYLRIRITSAANGMTTFNPTGYFGDGEVEDYYVFVTNTPLDVKLVDFSARKISDGKVSLGWSVTDEDANTRYELQKSGNSQSWTAIHNLTVQNGSSKAAYESEDLSPFNGINYYRLKITKPDGNIVYSAIKKIVFEKPLIVQVAPNPASANARLSIQSDHRASAHLRIVDLNGRSVYERAILVEEGVNGFTLPAGELPSGVYQVEIWVDTRRYNQRLIVRR